MASPPFWTELRMASAAARDNFEGSLASQINACVSRRIIGRRLQSGYGGHSGRSSELYGGGGSFLNFLGLKDLPIFQGNYWRFDVPNDIEFVGHEAEDVVILRLNGNDFDDGLAAFGYDDRFACGLNIVHYFQAAGFEGAGAHLLHGLFSVTMVILT
jgi:hypothetical protein